MIHASPRPLTAPVAGFLEPLQNIHLIPPAKLPGGPISSPSPWSVATLLRAHEGAQSSSQTCPLPLIPPLPSSTSPGFLLS